MGSTSVSFGMTDGKLKGLKYLEWLAGVNHCFQKYFKCYLQLATVFPTKINGSFGFNQRKPGSCVPCSLPFELQVCRFLKVLRWGERSPLVALAHSPGAGNTVLFPPRQLVAWHRRASCRTPARHSAWQQGQWEQHRHLTSAAGANLSGSGSSNQHQLKVQ